MTSKLSETRKKYLPTGSEKLLFSILSLFIFKFTPLADIIFTCFKQTKYLQSLSLKYIKTHYYKNILKKLYLTKKVLEYESYELFYCIF